MIYDHHLHADDHPAAMFGLIIGTLAVLSAVLVFGIYAHADGARRAAERLPAIHTVQQQH